MAAADPGKAVLQAIDMLTNQAQEAEEHAERCKRLEKVLDPELTENMVTCASASYSHAAASFGSTQPLINHVRESRSRSAPRRERRAKSYRSRSRRSWMGRSRLPSSNSTRTVAGLSTTKSSKPRTPLRDKRSTR